MGEHWLLGFIKPRWCDIQRREAELNIAPTRFNKSNNQCLPIEYMFYYMPYIKFLSHNFFFDYKQRDTEKEILAVV